MPNQQEVNKALAIKQTGARVIDAKKGLYQLKGGVFLDKELQLARYRYGKLSGAKVTKQDVGL